jgi:hypothetical protein
MKLLIGQFLYCNLVNRNMKNNYFLKLEKQIRQKIIDYKI